MGALSIAAMEAQPYQVVSDSGEKDVPVQEMMKNLKRKN